MICRKHPAALKTGQVQLLQDNRGRVKNQPTLRHKVRGQGSITQIMGGEDRRKEKRREERDKVQKKSKTEKEQKGIEGKGGGRKRGFKRKKGEKARK